MRWSIYLLACLIALAFDASVGGILRIGEAQPRLVLAVVVFALLSAPRIHALRVAFLAGFLTDLLAPAIRPDGTQLVVIGPWTLGFALGALAVVPLRSLLYHRNPIASGFATAVFGTLAAVVFVAIWVLRMMLLKDETPAWWPGTNAGETTRQVKSAIASGALAVPAIWLLERTKGIWAFSTAKRVIPAVSREMP
jgi:hypothetical protein